MTSPSSTAKPKLLRISEVCDWICVSKSTIYKWVHDGAFPAPLVLGPDDGKASASRWREEEIQAWLDERPRGRGNA